LNEGNFNYLQKLNSFLFIVICSNFLKFYFIAANVLSQSPHAIHLSLLQTLNTIRLVIHS
jgi:hypothetical protein